MAGDFIEILGEFGVRVSMTLMQQAIEPVRGIDRTALANVVFDSAVEQAYLIAKHVGIGRQLDDERFGMMVGIINKSQLDMVEYLTGTTLSWQRDCTRDCEQSCNRAFMKLKGQGE